MTLYLDKAIEAVELHASEYGDLAAALEILRDLKAQSASEESLACAIVKNGGAHQISGDCVHISSEEWARVTREAHVDRLARTAAWERAGELSDELAEAQADIKELRQKLRQAEAVRDDARAASARDLEEKRLLSDAVDAATEYAQSLKRSLECAQAPVANAQVRGVLEWDKRNHAYKGPEDARSKLADDDWMQIRIAIDYFYASIDPKQHRREEQAQLHHIFSAAEKAHGEAPASLRTRAGNGEFKECTACAAKLGTPTLCAGCIHNRAIIATLSGANQVQRAEVDQLREWQRRNQLQLDAAERQRQLQLGAVNAGSPPAEPARLGDRVLAKHAYVAGAEYVDQHGCPLTGKGLDDQFEAWWKRHAPVSVERVERALHVERVSGWRKGVLEGIDKLTAYQHSVGNFTYEKARELLNKLLENPPEELP